MARKLFGDCILRLRVAGSTFASFSLTAAVLYGLRAHFLFNRRNDWTYAEVTFT